MAPRLQKWFREDQAEKRKYLRLAAVVPVKFQIVSVPVKFQIMSEDYSQTVSGPFDGFIKNVGRGGLCVESKPLKMEKVHDFVSEKTRLKLMVNLPDVGPIEGYGIVRWIQRRKDPLKDKFRFGVAYEDFPEAHRDRLIKYTLRSWKKRVVKNFVLIILAATVLTLSILVLYIIKG